MVGKDSSGLQVDPAVLADIAQSLSCAAEYLQGQLRELNGQIGEMLGGWQGQAGGTYSAVWEQWHHGATEVESALASLADLIGQAGMGFESNETASAATTRAVHDG